MNMTWQVLFHGEFDPEFEALPTVVQDELLAQLMLLKRFGPQPSSSWVATSPVAVRRGSTGS